MKKLISLFIVHCSLFIGAAHAVAPCAVCTAGVAAGLEAARILGVDDAITGVWAGALTLLLVFWTLKWLRSRNIQNGLAYLAVFVMYYALLAAVYLMPGIEFGANALFGIDKFALGAIVGTIAMFVAENRLAKSIRENGGKSRYRFQKAIVPMSALILTSVAFAAIVYL